MVNRKVYNGYTSELQKELSNLFQLIDDQEVCLYFFFFLNLFYRFLYYNVKHLN